MPRFARAIMPALALVVLGACSQNGQEAAKQKLLIDRMEITDLLGVDLRGADVSGADLSGALFLTQPQVNAARGDGRSALPGRLVRPAHWARHA